AYDHYLRAATNLQVTESRPRSPTDALLEFSSVKQETDKLLQLGIALAGAHRDTLNSFVADSNHSLANLRAVLLTLLSLLLLFGAGLASVTYRDLIAPLRVKLVESHALLERQEKLASLGVLAAGLAHEIRNPLTAIKARLFTQQKVLRPESRELQDSVVIGNEIDRLEHIVKAVLLFARPAEPKFADVLVGTLFSNVRDLLGPQLEKNLIQL